MYKNNNDNNNVAIAILARDDGAYLPAVVARSRRCLAVWTGMTNNNYLLSRGRR